MKREEGYYWVKCLNESEFEIALYYKTSEGGYWCLMNSEVNWLDSDFDEIDERRIHEPE